ncbi:MAG: hypothetical protein METHSR3v1_1290005 [Methanothrix sp.]|nr:MAG: hypothetical protein METHSR3v1_1290005 [Methanothrix sp.]
MSGPKALSKINLHKVKCNGIAYEGIVCYSVRPFSTKAEHPCKADSALDLPNVPCF